MKKYIKENFAYIIVLLIMIIWGASAFYQEWSWQKSNLEWHRYYAELCKKGNPSVCSYIPKGEPEPRPRDTLSTFFYTTNDYDTRIFQMLAPLFVVTVGIWDFHRKIKKGHLKNALTRTDYSHHFKKNYLKALKSVWVFPIYFIFMIVLAYLVSGHFDMEYTRKYYQYGSYIPDDLLQNWPIFVPIYVLNIMLHSVFWLNIGIMCVKKNSNVFVSIIASYLVYLLIWILFGGFIGLMFFGNTPLEYYFQFGVIWSFEGVNYLGLTLMSSFIAIVSTIIVFISYKNKEEIVIESEK